MVVLGLLGGSFGGLGGSWAAIGRLLGGLGRLLRPSWAVMGCQGRFKLLGSADARHLGRF